MHYGQDLVKGNLGFGAQHAILLQTCPSYFTQGNFKGEDRQMHLSLSFFKFIHRKDISL